jgi:dTMP kinase
VFRRRVERRGKPASRAQWTSVYGETVNRGQLIAFEGLDGCGKSTQVTRLAAALRAVGHDVVETREPTNGKYGQRIRSLAKSGGSVTHAEELRWFVEDRREHVAAVVEPALSAGRVVVCDRYFLSTVAYQGARGADADEVLESSEAEFPIPDLVVLLEITPDAGLARVHERGRAIESHFEEVEYLMAVDAIFRRIDRPYLVRIDGSANTDAVESAVAECVAERLRLP